MKIMTLQGSPRRSGCTATLLGAMEEQMRELGAEVERVEALQLGLAPCLGCGSCQRKYNEPGCTRKDGGNEFFNRMLAADMVVFGTPIYFWGYPSSMKAVIDRSHCLVNGYMSEEHRSLMEGTQVALLLTCGGPQKANTDEVRIPFRRYTVYLKATHSGELVVPFCSEASELKPGHKEAARKFARALLGIEPPEPRVDDEDDEEEPEEVLAEDESGDGEPTPEDGAADRGPSPEES
jgi:multimeric flavodoxin WrbA